jgi:peptidoglycan/xylan/chitin deacetylase (PgdA/CDA1 family)
MKKNLIIATSAVFCVTLFFPNCTQSSASHVKKEDRPSSLHLKPSPPAADALTIMNRAQVPILCYHHIRDIKLPSRSVKGYEVTVEQFRQQMKILADSGYQSILPDQLHEYLTKGTELPSKPVMITFDDTDEEQFTIAKSEMDKYGFKAVYFVMNISIGRPKYMTREQIRQLSNEGHVIGCHTYDHHRVDKYKYQDTVEYRGQKKVVNDWDFQLGDTKKVLEGITGKPVEYFAYPFGIWNRPAIPEIKKLGYKLAFQLSEKRDSTEPLYTVRRMIVAPSWSSTGVLKVMKGTFK